jgi:hypothetical protein
MSIEAEALESQEAVEPADAETSIVADAPTDAQDGEQSTEAEAEEAGKAEKAQTRKHYRERAKTSRLEQENRQLREQAAQQQAERNAPELAEPNRDDFNDYEKFLDARAEWIADTRFSELQTKAEARNTERERMTHAGQIEDRWNETLEEARELHDDFDDVINGEVSITPDMAAAVKMAKGGAEIAYFLGKDLKESDRIARLPPLEQIMAIGAIGERLKERSTRPKPPKPVSRGRTSQTTSSNSLNDNMSADEWQRARNKQVGRS